jgi:hypothetical protein
VKSLFKRNKKNLASGEILVEATQKMSWEADEPPVVVESLVPRDDFIVTQRSYSPYQNSKRSSVVADVDTLQNKMVKRAAREKRIIEEDAKEAAFVERHKQ